MENIETHDALPICDNKAVLEIMKTLFSQLNSLSPHNWSSKEVAMLPNQLEVAANYIKAMRQKIDNMKDKIRQHLVISVSQVEECNKSEKGIISLRAPQINIHSMGSSLMVVAVTGLEGQQLFFQLVSAIEEEGAQVVNANLVTTNEKIFHTIHSQAPDQIGDKYDPSILTERLKRLVDSL